MFAHAVIIGFSLKVETCSAPVNVLLLTNLPAYINCLPVCILAERKPCVCLLCKFLILQFWPIAVQGNLKAIYGLC
jgi:hypothetical protein